MFEPVSLHKYLYANANPVMNSDPTGYFTLGDLNVSQAIENVLHNMLTPSFSSAMKWLNFFATLCDTANQMGEMLHDGATLADIAKAMLDGALSGFLLNQMCFIKGIGPFIGVALAAYGYYAQIEALNQAIQDGDYLTAAFKSVQLITSATAIGDSCFTGDTLVTVDGGQKRIDRIEVGDKVWAYNVETGETELKAVAKVYVHSVYEILHLYTDEGDIDTTANHPFYVIGKGWVAAGNLADGDEVYNLDGITSTILGSEIEVLDEPVLVYNLEVEDFHSYFVGCVPVLVHNRCKLGKNMEKAGNYPPQDGNTYNAHHIFPQKFRKFFKKELGIDIDDAQFGIWVEQHEHLINAKSYNDLWDVEIVKLKKGVERDQEFFRFVRNLKRLW